MNKLEMNKSQEIRFSAFYPMYGNKNPNIRYFAILEDKKKKELKHFDGDIYYFCKNRKRIFVEVTGNLYARKFKILGEK